MAMNQGLELVITKDSLTWDEFIKEFTAKFIADQERDILERFKGYDMDGDGKISVEDYRNNYKQYGDDPDEETIKYYM